MGVKALALDAQCSSWKAGGGWREGRVRLAEALQSLDLTVDARQRFVLYVSERWFWRCPGEEFQGQMACQTKKVGPNPEVSHSMSIL